MKVCGMGSQGGKGVKETGLKKGEKTYRHGQETLFRVLEVEVLVCKGFCAVDGLEGLEGVVSFFFFFFLSHYLSCLLDIIANQNSAVLLRFKTREQETKEKYVHSRCFRFRHR